MALESLTYLLMILGWSLPVIFLQWAFGWRELRAKRPVWAVAIAVPTLYLGLADFYAIEEGIWSINEDKTLPLRSGGFVFEEWLFFLVTNTMVVQTIILTSDPALRERAWRVIRRR